MKRQTCECRDCHSTATWWTRFTPKGYRSPETRLVCHQHLQHLEAAARQGALTFEVPPRSTSTRRQAPRRQLRRAG